MKHPKARNEIPEQVKARVEEARKKLKKANDTSIEKNYVCHNAEIKAESPVTAAVPFPDFPELDLSILKA
jgi:hypothetical protein